MDASVFRRGLLVLAAAALVTGAGCMATIGETTKEVLGAEADGDEDAGASGTESGGTEAAYGDAFETLGGDGPVSRYAMDVHAEALDGSETTDAKLLVDEETPMFLLTLREAGSEVGTADEGPLLIGQVGKTTLFGSPEELVGMYNESSAPPHEDLGSPMEMDAGGQPAGSTEDLSNPMALVETIDELPTGAEVSRERVTVDGEDAVRADVTFENDTHRFDYSATVYTDPPRPASIEGTFDGPDTSLAGSGPANVSITYAYGEDAEHEHERKAVRAEAVTFFDEQTLGSFEFGSEGEGGAWTIQPSVNPGSVPLDEVTVLVRDQGGFEGEAETVLSLDPADGSAENEDVAVSYEDADGDGAVSPGDTIELSPKHDDATGYSVAIEDEVTGVRTTPGAGALFAMLVGLTLAAVRRRP